MSNAVRLATPEETTQVLSVSSLPYDDPEIREAVSELNQLRSQVLYEDRHADPWEALTLSELEWIKREIARCAKDFRYAASHYFWLGQTMEAATTLLKLWPQQELFFSIMEWLWDQGRPAWIMVHKARQLGLTSIMAALLAWKNLFFDHQISMIVAQDPPQAQHVLKIVLYMIDHMPWFMRPMESSREFKEAVILENKDPTERAIKAGLDNWIMANGCNRISSFGQGKPLHNVHLTEIPSWRPEDRAMEIIEGDLKYGLNPTKGDQRWRFCVMEGKPKGVGGYWYKLWHVFDADGPSAQYFPFYVPAFFEDSRRIPPPKNWQPSDDLVKIREDYQLEWRRCNQCGTPVPMRWGERECFRCGSEEQTPLVLDNDQLYWYDTSRAQAEKEGKEELKYFYQEMSITPEQGFQHSGISVFPDDVMFRLQKTCHPGERGFFDDQFQWHRAQRCNICHDDHYVGPAEGTLSEEFPAQMWELPRQGAKYVVGADVSEGYEDGDYSSLHVIRIGYGLNVPDEQVFGWHGHMDTDEFARVVYLVGRAYNDAMVGMDALSSAGRGCQAVLMVQYNYPQIYVWKHIDALKRRMSNKAGVWPNWQTKGAMISKAIRWLRRGFWIVHSPRFLEEAPFFVKDEDEAQARALRGQFDDEISSGIYAIWTAHEDDMNPQTGRFAVPEGPQPVPAARIWAATCVQGHRFDTDDPRNAVCPECRAKNPDSRGLVKTAEKKENNEPEDNDQNPKTALARSLLAMHGDGTQKSGLAIPPFEHL